MSKKSPVFYVKPTLLALAAAACASAAAQESTQTLSEVVVSASGFEQELKQAPASISVVTREELEKKNFRDLAEALKDVPGIDVLGATGKTGGLNISIRGMSSDYTLILIDGRRQNPGGDVTPNGFSAALNGLMPPISAIERIEVIRGPMSTLYGSDALGGVINIITRKVSKEWGGEVSVQTGQPQHSEDGAAYKTSLYLNGPIKQDMLGLAIRGDVSRQEASDLIRDPALDPSAPNNSRNPAPGKNRKHTIGAKLTLTPSKSHDIWLDVEQNRSWNDNSDGRLGNRDAASTNAQIPGYADEMRFNRDQVALGHTSRFDFGLLESSIMRNDTETIGRTIPHPRTGLPYPGTRAAPGEHRTLQSENLVFDTKFVTTVTDTHLLTTGAQYTKSTLIDAYLPKDHQRTTYAFFAEDEWQLSDALTATFGGRYDHHNAFGGHVSPRAYLVWNATPQLTLKGGISKGFKSPDVRSLIEGSNNVGGQGANATIGNPDLKPEISTSTEFSVLFDNLQGFNSSATLFHNKIKDKITGSGNCDINPIASCSANKNAGTPYNINVDQAKTWGLELTSRAAINAAWSVSAAYTWTDSELIEAGEVVGKLSDTAKHIANAQVNWAATDKLNLWLRGEYRGKSRRFDTPSTTDSRVTELFGNDIKAYTLFHLGASYKLSKQVTLSGNIYNLFDKDLKTGYKSLTIGNTTHWGGDFFHAGQSIKGFTPAGRTLWLTANIQF